jgi:hypothetical protein
MLHRFAVLLLVASTVVLLGVPVTAQPPEGGKDQKEGKGPPPRFAPGTLFPPGLREELNLTADQEKELASLESEVKQKLDKLLTPEQKTKIDEFRPRGPRGEARGEKGDKGDKGEKGDKGKSKFKGEGKGDKGDKGNKYAPPTSQE